MARRKSGKQNQSRDVFGNAHTLNTSSKPISDQLTLVERSRIESANKAKRVARIDRAGTYRNGKPEPKSHSLPRSGFVGACEAFQTHTNNMGNNDPRRRGWSRIDDPENVGWWSR